MIPGALGSASLPSVGDSPYSHSIFRLLGLTADASPQQVEARVQELRAAEGGPPERPPLDLGWLPEVRQDGPALEEALQQAGDLETRLWERLFWFHQGSPVDARALQALREGRPEEAEDLWRQAWREGETNRATTAHNLAVLLHSRAMAAPRGEAVARRDYDQARRWWRHVIDGGRLAVLMTHGEADRDRAGGAAQLVERTTLARLQDLLTPGVVGEARKLAGPTGFIPLLGGDWVVGEDLGSERSQSMRGLMLAALEEAEEAVRLGDRAAFEESMERAREVCPSPTDQRLVDATLARLARRLVCRNLKPVRRPPRVVSMSGLGTTLWGLDKVDAATRSYETSLMFTVAHLPLVPLGRYRVAEREDGTYDFLGRMPLDGWVLLHWLVLVGILMVVFWGASNLTQLSTRTVTGIQKISEGAPAQAFTLTPQELEELRTSATARRLKLTELSATLEKLGRESRHLKEVVIPDLDMRVKDDHRRIDDGEVVFGSLERERELDGAWKRYRAIPAEMKQVRQLRARIEQMEKQGR